MKDTNKIYDNMLENKLNEIEKRITEALSQYDWRDDPKLSRDWEKSDVSQDEFERSRGFGRYAGGRYNRPTRTNITGMTFFNVPAGKEQVATSLGLTQTKSGKWGIKHRGDKSLDKDKVDAAEKEFGTGRYWQPNS